MVDRHMLLERELVKQRALIDLPLTIIIFTPVTMTGVNQLNCPDTTDFFNRITRIPVVPGLGSEGQSLVQDRNWRRFLSIRIGPISHGRPTLDADARHTTIARLGLGPRHSSARIGPLSRLVRTIGTRWVRALLTSLLREQGAAMGGRGLSEGKGVGCNGWRRGAHVYNSTPWVQKRDVDPCPRASSFPSVSRSERSLRPSRSR
jgi:hypothetical protein